MTWRRWRRCALLQVLWADPVPGGRQEAGSGAAAAAAGPRLVRGESAILDRTNRTPGVDWSHTHTGRAAECLWDTLCVFCA